MDKIKTWFYVYFFEFALLGIGMTVLISGVLVVRHGLKIWRDKSGAGATARGTVFLMLGGFWALAGLLIVVALTTKIVRV